ncbi:hypothetical protein N7470_009243 [Penicillium chermesinum]|nr:hypothetical protein N7470_009243 [Penicillium chermesinum]
MRTAFSSLLPALLLLQQTCAAGPNQAPLGESAPSNPDEKPTEPLDGTAEPEPYQISQRVQEAWDTLRTAKPAIVRTDRPTGLLGNALHYGGEVFRLLFMNGPTTEKSDSKINPTVARAVRELKAAADEDADPDAMFLLAEMNFYGNFTYPRDFGEAFLWYNELAWLNGNNTAQSMVGFMYATGIGGAVERDQARALMYHEFAAETGNTRSEMTLAYRYHTGIGTPRTAIAIQYLRSGPPGGNSMIKESYRWADDEGGVYGEGASVSSSGYNARDASHSSSDASVEDVLEYLDLLSKKGELKATYTLAKMNYEGERGLPRNFKKSMRYFKIVARKYWNRDGSISQNAPTGLDKLAAKAAGHIGRMYLRGEGVEQNFGTALTWFKRGVVNADALCQHHMGLMYLHGYGVNQDAYKASSYFTAAADQDLAASHVRLGALFLTKEIYQLPLATLNWRLDWAGWKPAYYKLVAEKAEVLHSAFAEANEAYENGDKERALIPSMMAAEQGYENAQANVAFILDEQRSLFPLDALLPWGQKSRSSLLHNAALALIYWTRSAKQANIDSLIKMGDYYLSGTGSKVDAEKASICYHNAAEAHHSAQAYWNLGWMHENGVAVAQDFHMAKRYYDLALEANKEAYLPVKLSLLKLRARGYWNQLTNGDINPIRDDEDSKPPRTLKEWYTAFIENDAAAYYEEFYDSHADEDDFMGSRGLESERQDDGYYDDVELDIDDGILEGLIIVGLAAALLVLVYLRQQQQRNRPNQDANANGNANGGNANGNGNANDNVDNDRGFFPDPNAPEFAQWVAGGVGH